MRELWTLIVVSVVLSAAADANTVVVSDNFNRPDGPAGNGWVDSTGNVAAAPTIVGGRLKGAATNGSASISRPISASFPISVTATVGSGFGNSPGRYGTAFDFTNSAVNQSQYAGLFIGRSDFGSNNSSVVYAGQVLDSPFQYDGSDLAVAFTINLDGSLSGTVTQGTNVFPFSYGSRPISASPAYFQLGFDVNQGSVDDLTLTAIPEPGTRALLFVAASAFLCPRNRRHPRALE
jgi:hypothetical protein